MEICIPRNGENSERENTARENTGRENTHNGNSAVPKRDSLRPGSVSFGPGPVWRLPLGGEEFVEGAPRGIPECLLLRSGAEDVPA